MNKIKCLDKGFVEYICHMGDDKFIADVARNTTNTKGNPDKDKRLIRRLIRDRHTSPFEFVQFVFRCKLPMFVARQWYRHRTGSFSEISARFSQLPEEAWVPEQSREQGTNNRQVGDKPITDKQRNITIQTRIKDSNLDTHYLYTNLLHNYNLCREQARTVLPMGQYTQFMWRTDLHNLFHFLKLRLAPDAQKEIRVYAEAIFKIIKEYVPVCCEAFEDYILNAVSFSNSEIDVLKASINDKYIRHNQEMLTKTEYKEFRNKLGLKNE